MKPTALAALAVASCFSLPARAEAPVFHPDLEEARAHLAHAQGPEVYAALRRVWAAWDRASPVHVEELLLAAERDPSLEEPARAYAGLLSAYARFRRGDLTGARDRISALGFVDRWLVAGPFDDEGKSGFDAEFEPEREFRSPLVPGRAYSGKEGAVRYRQVPDAFPYGYLDGGSLVRPDRKVCLFATTFVTKPAARGRLASVWVGSEGAFKLFWNGAEVLRDGAYRSHDADRYGAVVVMRDGPNNLTVKVCNQERAPLVSVRLGDERGRPDPALSVSNAFEASQAAAANAVEPDGAATLPAGPRGPMQRFTKLVEKKTPSARELAAFAEYLEATGGDDPTAHAARDLARRAVEAEPTVDRLLLAARLAEDRNQRARWIEQAEKQAGAGTNTDVLLAKAALLNESMNFGEAFPLYERVLAIDPDNLTAIQGRVMLHNEAGLRRTALSILERAMQRQPESVTLLNMYASQLSILGRTTEAAEVQARYAALRFDDRSFQTERLELGIARRNRDATEHFVERLLQTEPDSLWAHGVAARALRAFGQPERAAATYRQALELAPEDTDTLRSLGDLLGSLGRRDEQLALMHQILRITPQDKEARQYVEFLEPSGSRPDEKYAWEPERFLQLEHTATRGENRRTLVDLTVATVFENGLSRKFRQVVFQPLTDAAAALARQYSFTYQADRERVQLRGARVFRADGRIDEAIESGEGAADNPSIAMYTSARTFYVQFPRLEPKDVVELRYRVDDVSAQNEFADYFGDVAYLQSSEPTLHGEYVLVTPKSRQFFFDHHGIPNLEHTVREEKTTRVHRFFAKAIPAIVPEPSMPPWPSILGFVHVSTYKSWKELGEWYWGLAKDQFDLDEQTRNLARTITKDAKTEVEKVRAVYDWVVTNTRYVALEFGIEGFKPRRCVQTVSRGWGDCKDKATVIVTLLKELGIDATIVIVRTRLRGDFDSKIASLAPFDHAIAYVPSLDLYLDGTAEWTGSNELPVMDRGAIALQINEGDAKLVRLPVGAPEDDLRRREVTVDLEQDGGASLVLRYETRGAQAASWRRRYHAEATQRERVTEDVGRQFPGFTLAPGEAGLATSSLTDLESPVVLTARGTTERFARREGTSLTMDVTVNPRLSSTYATLSSRTLPVAVPPLGVMEDTVVVRVPAGMKIESTPIPVQQKSEFGAYSIQVEKGDGKVTIKSRVSVGMREIAPSDYAKWKAFCAEVDHVLSSRLVIGSK